MKREYRIEICHKNETNIIGTVFSSLETIKKLFEGEFTYHPIVYVYTKYGKKPVMVFEG